VTRAWATALDLAGPRHAQRFVDPDDISRTQWEVSSPHPGMARAIVRQIHPVRVIPSQYEENTDVHSPLALTLVSSHAAGRIGLLLVAS
ncbi:MAG TPA: hypothetical protein VF241_13340, partial [Propionibacteriaceae bacterium]